MKNIYKVFSMALVLVFSACTSDFEELNTDPNNPTLVPAENLFTQAQFSLSNRVWGRAMNFEFGMLMVQHFSQNEYAEDSRYNQNASTFSASWDDLYAGGLNDLSEARILVEADESLTETERNNKLAQIAILRVWAFQNITDIWGDVPYSEALQPEEFTSPSYDSQEDIYAGLVVELNAAIGAITASGSGFTSGDIIFGGNMADWGRFANSLKVRLGMRMADANASSAATIVSEAFNNSLGVISSNAENATFQFGSDQNIANPFFVDAITRDDFAISKILVDNMNANEDPRLEMYAEPNNNDVILGLEYGLTDAQAFANKSNTSRPSETIKQATAPAMLMSYSEVEFFRAEAIERNMISGTASTAYDNAVLASQAYWGVSTADAAAYLAANPYNAADWEASIGYEKWVALYTQGLEAWSERRRLDEPALPVPAAAVINMVPVRAFYPASEAEANSTNLSEVGFNDMETKMWWDVN